MKTLSNTFAAFVRDEDGAALSEYLVLLGLLVGGVIIAVTTFGTNLSTAFTQAATWVDGLGDKFLPAGAGAGGAEG